MTRHPLSTSIRCATILPRGQASVDSEKNEHEAGIPKSEWAQSRGSHKSSWGKRRHRSALKTTSSRLWVTEPGRLWYMTSQEALTQRFGFKQLSLDPTRYMRGREGKRLMSVVRVDNYLYAGSPVLASKFRQFMQNQFFIGSTEARCFSKIGALLVQTNAKRITIDARAKLYHIQLWVLATSMEKDRPATEDELTAYQSFIVKLLYDRSLAGLIVSLLASQAATKCADLCLHRLRSLAITMHTIRKFHCAITYLPGERKRFKFEAVSDASMKTTDTNPTVQESMKTYTVTVKMLRSIRCTSILSKQMALRMSTSELLAAADAVDELTYFKHLVEENLGS